MWLVIYIIVLTLTLVTSLSASNLIKDLESYKSYANKYVKLHIFKECDKKQTFKATSSKSVIKKEIFNIVINYSIQQKVDPALALAIGEVESAFNQDAISNKCAIGIFQLMPKTAKDELFLDNPYDTLQNIMGGVKYISILQSKFSALDDVIAAYNCGPDRVMKRNKLPQETKEYLRKVKKAYKKYTIYMKNKKTSLLVKRRK